jgi:hypothetical protein
MQSTDRRPPRKRRKKIARVQFSQQRSGESPQCICFFRRKFNRRPIRARRQNLRVQSNAANQIRQPFPAPMPKLKGPMSSRHYPDFPGEEIAPSPHQQARQGQFVRRLNRSDFAQNALTNCRILRPDPPLHQWLHLARKPKSSPIGISPCPISWLRTISYLITAIIETNFDKIISYVLYRYSAYVVWPSKPRLLANAAALSQ